MFDNSDAFGSFSVDDLDAAERFYSRTLGLKVTKEASMGLQIHLASGARIFVYAKPNHEPATYTVLNFEVEDIDQAVEALAAKGVTFERYGGELAPDAKGIVRGGEGRPSIAWFKDPARNVLSVLQM